MAEYLLRNADVIDGSGGPARQVDVHVKDGRIAAIGDLGRVPGAEVVDLSGLVLSPGFIDNHTHLDAQVLWDADLTPSTWHGVTTVVLGNCGFGVAPAKPEHQDLLLRTLENSEGMSLEALRAGVTYDYKTFPEYLDVIDARPKRCNVAAMVGHSQLRVWVMGEDANKREATREEIAAQRELVAEALDAGAIGFGTCVASRAVGLNGGPVPSAVASWEEICELAGAMRGRPFGVMQMLSDGFGYRDPADRADQVAALADAMDTNIVWAPFVSGAHGDQTVVEALEIAAAKSDRLIPATHCKEIIFQITMLDPFPLISVAKAFEQVVSLPREERPALYRDEAWRARARAEISTVSEWVTRWHHTRIAETTVHTHLINGPSIAELAAEQGKEPVDVAIELALEDNLETRFACTLFNGDKQQVHDALRHPRSLVSLSDAGAHASQMFDGNYATYLLSEWVRDRQTLTLAEAIHKLTGQQADVFEIRDRGRIKEGHWADLVAFDPETVGTGELERVFDLPAGADRLIAHSSGIHAIWVNGEATRIDGKDVTGSHPGTLVRGGQ
jgi:N-acyl-D-aspartate/D-glutamate deacylase